MLRLDRLILACRPLDLIVRPFQALLPVVVELPALSLYILSHLQADLQRRRLQRVENVLTDEIIQHLTHQGLTARLAIVHRQAATIVT
jgi:hypothetical protein